MSTPMLRDAATIMLVREAPDGFEVLLLRRNKDLAFAGGAHVFPGGSVDTGDADPWILDRCVGVEPGDFDGLLGVPNALRFAVAALREAYEEAGILLRGSSAALDQRELEGQLHRQRTALISGERSFRAIVEDLDLSLDAGALAYVAHWITPQGAPRRFDTRFFLARVPSDQLATPDRSEIVGEVWITPQDALAHYREGVFDLVLPTVKNLEFLASFHDVDALMDAARSLSMIEAIQPRFYRRSDGSVAVALPGSPEFDQASETILAPGEALPTRPSDAQAPPPA
jgi:8-oxo-dGTP pyrophosphatase MutT (NUDIX family)